MDKSLKIILFLINAWMAFMVGFLWHKGYTASTLVLVVFFILDAVQGLRERINDRFNDLETRIRRIS